MADELSGPMEGLGLCPKKAADQTDLARASPESKEDAKREPAGDEEGPESPGQSKAESAGGGAAEENQPRLAADREGATELRDVVDDALLHLLRCLGQASAFESLCALELSCRRLNRLATSRRLDSVFEGVNHVKLVKNAAASPDNWGGHRDRRLCLPPDFAPLAGGWVAVLEHVRERGAVVRVLELAAYCERLPEQLLYHMSRAEGAADLQSLECLVLVRGCAHYAFETDDWTEVMDEEELLRPARLPALRVLIVDSTWDSKELYESWKDTSLVCLKTPMRQHSFLKGPKDQHPHPDLLRLSERYKWAD